MPHPSHPPWLNYPVNRTNIAALHCAALSTIMSLPLFRSEYFPQHPVLKHHHFMWIFMFSQWWNWRFSSLHEAASLGNRNPEFWGNVVFSSSLTFWPLQIALCCLKHWALITMWCDFISKTDATFTLAPLPLMRNTKFYNHTNQKVT